MTKHITYKFFCRRGLQWRRLHLLIFFTEVIKFYWLMLLYPGELYRLLGASSSFDHCVVLSFDFFRLLITAFGVFKLLWHTQQLIEIYKTIENDYLNRLCWLIEWCCLESIRYRQTLDTFQHFIFSRFFFCESYDQLNSWKH